MDIESILSELCPEPSPEDVADMNVIAFAVARISSRNATKAAARLAEARGQLAKLIEATERGGTQEIA